MSYYIIGLLLSLMSWACSDDVETGREEIPVETDGGYLFAHMTNANYGKLYYAASRDGVNWETLNKDVYKRQDDIRFASVRCIAGA